MKPARSHTVRAASSGDRVLTEDLAALEAHHRVEVLDSTRLRAQAERVALLPMGWRGKRYRRSEQERNPEQRERKRRRLRLTGGARRSWAS